jgi:hypothetical protein
MVTPQVIEIEAVVFQSGFIKTAFAVHNFCGGVAD